MPSVIDKLPEVQRQRVVAALLQGQSLRKAASLAGVSHTQVAKYKNRVLAPTLRAAEKLQAIHIVADSDDPSTVSPATLTKAAIAAEPIRSRIALHQQTIDRSIKTAEEGKDARAIAALIRTDLSGLELDAKLTGLLDGPSHVTVNNLAIVMSPKSEALEPAIDAHCEQVSDSSEPAE